MWEGKVTQNRLSPDFKSPEAGIYDTDFFILLHSKRKCLAISRFFHSPMDLQASSRYGKQESSEKFIICYCDKRQDFSAGGGWRVTGSG